MGVYVPAPVATPAIMDEILKKVLQPTISGMRREGQFSGPLKRLYSRNFLQVSHLWAFFL